MALQVWLPLNGDLHNQGLSNLTFEILNTSRTTINAAGKIGNCYNNDSFSGGGLLSNATINLGTNQSMCCWVNFTELNSSSNLGGGLISQHRRDNNTGFGMNIKYVSSTTGYLTVSTGNGTNRTYVTYTGNTLLQANTWYHVGCTYDGSYIKLYVNGQLDLTQAYVGMSVPADYLTIFCWSLSGTTGNTVWGGYKLKGKLNDVRVYNHCLSTKEIEEIAKGLVLHYKLDEPLQLADNLMPNHLTMGYGSANPSTGTWRNAGTSNMTKSRVQINDSPEGPCYGFQNEGIQTANDGSCYGIDNFPLQGNTTYTISMWARIVSGTEGYAGYYIYNISAELGGSHSKIDRNYRITTLPSDGSWIKCWYTFTTNASNSRNIFIGITTGDTTVTTQMCCVHIEKINKVALNNVYDSSGYFNNGTISGTLTAAAGSPRYGTATQFNGSSLIEADPLPTETLTISAWVNFADTSGGSYRLVLHDKNSGLAIGYYSSSIITYVGSSNGGTGSKVSADLIANTWYHIVVVKTGETTRDTYINGVKATPLANNWWGGDLNKLHIGGRYVSGAYSGYTTGKIVDVRAYVTALTAAQVKELYTTSMSIDASGNIIPRALEEL